MEKENMKPKKKNNNHEKLWKIIHVISYILSITFIFFIIIACVEGCQQKVNNQSQRNNNNLVEKSPNMLDINGTTITLTSDVLYDYDFIKGLNDYLYITYNLNRVTWGNSTTNYNLSTYIGTYDSQYNQPGYSFTPNQFGLYSNGSMLLKDSSLTIYFQVNSTYKSVTTWYGSTAYSIQYIKFINCTSNFVNYVTDYANSGIGYNEEDLSNAYDSGYLEGYSEGYFNGEIDGYNTGYEVGYNDGLSVNAEEVTNITIQYDYDFRNLISDNIDINTGLMRVSSSSGGLTTIETLSLSGLTFNVSDNVYNNVIIRTITLDQDLALAFEDNLNTSRTASELYPNNDYYYYRGLVSVSYRFLDHDNNVVREQRVVNGYSNFSGTNSNGIVVSGCFDFRNPTWVTNAFRFLTIDEDTGTKVNTPTFANTFTLKELLALDGNVTMSTNNTTTMFSLFSMAFGSVAGILGIAVLPNITLGLLLFIPLIVGIIVLILKAIKK